MLRTFFGNFLSKLRLPLFLFLTCYFFLEAGAFFIFKVGTGKWLPMGSSRINFVRNVIEQNVTSNVSGTAIHPYLGFVYKPSMLPTSSISSFGFFDSASPLRQRSSDKVLIGVFGGSVAWEALKYAQAEFESALRKSPKLRDKKIEFIKLAIPGYKQPQQLLALSYLLSLGAQFDYVINLDGFNEAVLASTENVPKGVFFAFPRSWYFRATNGLMSGDLRLMESLFVMSWLKARMIAVFEHPACRYSSLCGSIAYSVQEILNGKMASTRAALVRRPARSKEYQITGPSLPELSNETVLTDHLVDNWAQSSYMMHQLSLSYGAKYFHFLQPNQHDLGSKPMQKRELAVARAGMSGYARFVRLRYPRLRERGKDLRRKGVSFFDLTGIFKSRSEPLYKDDCCHLTPAGYEILVRELAEAIIARI